MCKGLDRQIGLEAKSVETAAGRTRFAARKRPKMWENNSRQQQQQFAGLCMIYSWLKSNAVPLLHKYLGGQNCNLALHFQPLWFAMLRIWQVCLEAESKHQKGSSSECVCEWVLSNISVCWWIFHFEWKFQAKPKGNQLRKLVTDF